MANKYTYDQKEIRLDTDVKLDTIFEKSEEKADKRVLTAKVRKNLRWVDRQILILEDERRNLEKDLEMLERKGK